MQKSKRKGQSVRLGRRALALLLCVCMITTLVPISAHAETKETEQGQIRTYANETNVAEVTIGSTTTQYADLGAAFAAAQEAESATVTLLSDVTNTAYKEGISLEKGDITFDLNGHTLTGYADSNYLVDIIFWVTGSYESDGTPVTTAALTIKDSEGNGKIVQPGYLPVIVVDEYGKLTVEGGIMENTSTVDRSEVLISSVVNCAILTSGETTIRGGTMSGKHGVVVNGGSLTVEDGTFTGEDGNALIVHEGTAQLSGGTYSNDTGKNEHSIWVMNDGKASSLLAEDYRYETADGKVSEYSENGNGVVGETTVKKRPEGEFAYIDKDGNEAVQTGCKELTSEALYNDKENVVGKTVWYAASGDITLSRTLSVYGTLNLILCDGATVTAEKGIVLGYREGPGVLNIYAQSAGTGRLTVTNDGYGEYPNQGNTAGIRNHDDANAASTLNICGGTVTAMGTQAAIDVGEDDYSGAGIGTYAKDTSGKTLNVNICGGTVIAKSGGKGAAAIGNGQASTGTVNVTIADGMKCVKTDDPNTPAAYDNTDGTSITITKCSDHKWKYIKGETNHTSECKLCGMTGTTEAHNYENWKEGEDADTHTGTCVCGATKTEAHSTTFAVNADGLTHTDRCSRCGREESPAYHSFDSSTGMCTCGALLAAKYDGKSYAAIQSAVDAAKKNNGTVTVQKQKTYQISEVVTVDSGSVTIDLNGDNWCEGTGYGKGVLHIRGGSVILKNGTLSQGGSGTTGASAIFLEDGSLTVEENVKIAGGYRGTPGQITYAIEVSGGELTLGKGVSLELGLKVPDGKKLVDYLPVGTAFEDEDGTILNGYTTGSTTENLKVVEHSHTFTKNEEDGGYYCSCGYLCLHRFGEDGKCTDCGYECPHEHVSETDGVTTCSDCKAQMVVKVTSGESDTYYAKVFDGYNTEETICAALKKAASGSTVTLLADGLYASGDVIGGKTITLDMNGRTLIETSQGVTVGDDSGSDENKLIVTGEGGSKKDLESTSDNCYTFRVREKGTLDLSDDSLDCKFRRICVIGGTLINKEKSAEITIDTLEIAGSTAKISFYTGNFGEIIINPALNSLTVAAGSLLKENYDVAFRHSGEDGAFVPYDTVISTSSPLKNVRIATCRHDRLGEENTCEYCGMRYITALRYMNTWDNMYAVATYQSESFREEDMQTSIDSAFNSLRNTCFNLKLFIDAKLGDKVFGGGSDVAIDLNGHKVTDGTLTLEKSSRGKSTELTITDSSEGKNGEFPNVKVSDGTSLIVDGVHLGTITAAARASKVTLKAGSSLEGYSLPEGMLLADWIEDGCFIYDTGEDGNSKIPVELTETGEKTAAGKFVVEKAAAQFTAGTKTGEITYGSSVPADFCPEVTLEDAAAYENFGSIKVDWYRRTDNGCKPIGSGTIENGTYVAADSESDFDGVKTGDSLDVFCKLTATAVDNASMVKTLWQTVLTGYELTVIKGNSSVITAPAAVKDMVYKAAETDKKWSLVTAGTAEGGTMVYSLSKEGQYTETIPTAENAGTYTIWYKVKGDDYHNDTEPESVTAQIAKAELVMDQFTLADKVYDGTTDAVVSSVTFINGEGQVIGSELVAGTDYTVKAAFEDARAGGSKKVKAIVALCDTEMTQNYVLTGNEAESTSGWIKKAPALAADSGTLYIQNNATAKYTFDLIDLLPELPDGCDFGGVTISHNVTSTWNSDAYSEVRSYIQGNLLNLEVTSTSSVEEEAGKMEINMSSDNYQDITLILTIKSTNKKIVELQTGSMVSPNGTLTYGQKLSELTFQNVVFVEHGTDNEVKGTLNWKTPDAVLEAGTRRGYWVFTPEDSEHYTELTGWTTITVKKADPVVSELPSVADRVYDPEKALTDVDLTGGVVNTDGTWNFTGADIIPTVDNTGYEAVFTPADTKNYNTIIRTIEVNVTKATPYIVETPSASAITYGDTLGESKLTGGKAAYRDANGTEIPGSFAWKELAEKPSGADSGVTEYEVVFTPDDIINYHTTEAKITLTVKKAAAPATAAGTLYILNNQSLTYDYELSELLPAIEGSKSLGKVTYGTPTIVWTGTGYQEKNVKVEESGKMTLVISSKNTAEGDAGTIVVTVKTENYEDITLTLAIKSENRKTVVLKEENTVSVQENGKLTYGQKLSDLILGDAVFVDKRTDKMVEGTLKWSNPDAVPDAGTTKADWVFVPAESDIYSEATGSAAITVEKATPYIAEKPSASEITEGELLDASKLTGGKATYNDAKGTEIAGSFAWKQGSLKPAVSDSGVTEYEVVFTPEDIKNYTTVNTKITIMVKAVSQTPETPSPSGTAAPMTTQTPAPEQTAKPESISQTQQKKNGLALNSKWKVTQTGKKIKIRWGKVTGATGYRVYVQYSDAKFKKKSAVYVTGTKSVLTVTKINGKKINLKKNFKVYVEACKMVNGKQVTLGKSLEAHVAGRKSSTYTNAKAIKLNKKAFTLKVGKSVKIKAKTVLKDKTQKALTKSKVKEFRYDTTDASVATVSSGGKITATGKGTCKIYVYARNGYTKTITVTVK